MIATLQGEAPFLDSLPTPFAEQSWRELAARSAEIDAFVAVSAYYGGEVFNQGAPKPDGSSPGSTAGPAGQIDPETGEFTLEWTSQISGGAFDGFTGVWHMEGVFEAS